MGTDNYAGGLGTAAAPIPIDNEDKGTAVSPISIDSGGKGTAASPMSIDDDDEKTDVLTRAMYNIKIG